MSMRSPACKTFQAGYSRQLTAWHLPAFRYRGCPALRPSPTQKGPAERGARTARRCEDSGLRALRLTAGRPRWATSRRRPWPVGGAPPPPQSVLPCLCLSALVRLLALAEAASSARTSSTPLPGVTVQVAGASNEFHRHFQGTDSPSRTQPVHALHLKPHLRQAVGPSAPRGASGVLGPPLDRAQALPDGQANYKANPTWLFPTNHAHSNMRARYSDSVYVHRHARRAKCRSGAPQQLSTTAPQGLKHDKLQCRSNTVDSGGDQLQYSQLALVVSLGEEFLDLRRIAKRPTLQAQAPVEHIAKRQTLLTAGQSDAL